MHRLIATLLVLTACDCGEDALCDTAADCAGGVCLDGRCVTAEDGGGDAGGDGGECAVVCGEGCCEEGQACASGTCRFDRGPCATSDTCPDDSLCEDGRCLGFDDPDRASCTLPSDPGVLRPELLCAWSGPPAGDAHPAFIHVQAMPLVADFGIDRGPDDGRRPSIVLVTTDVSGGTAQAAVIRVLDGASCTQQTTLADVQVLSNATPALGDLTGDGRPDIVAHALGGGLVAWERAGEGFRLLWHTPTGAVSGTHDLSLADLDDDGTPEIMAGAYVYSADGSLRSTVGAPGPSACGSAHGTTVAADVDRDGALELVADTMIYTLPPGGMLEPEPYFTAGGRAGYVAVADFGRFEGALGDGPETPEVVVVDQSVSIHTIGGEIVFGPVVLPGLETGGNPTVADFDGDGEPEIGVAALDLYTVFDPRCGDDTRPGTCEGGAGGILWSHTIRENSCAVMGSTVFDFEGDGRAEVVYADECYARIFDGRTGAVVWSHPNGSATWEEAPVVADVDGDYHADLLLPSVSYDGGRCGSHDAQHPGERCASDEDCPAGACRAGLCRCSADDDCTDPAYDCVAPIDGSDAEGSVCRAAFRDPPVGLRVFRDARRRWAASRPIWNQHGYFVANVDPNGVVPRGSAQAAHWLGAGDNSFRQNAQDDVAPDAAADLTVRGESFGRECSAEEPVLELVAAACNRGELPVEAGVDVAFVSEDGAEVCRAATTGPLDPGECESVSCTWTGPPIDVPLSLTIVVDPDAARAECRTGNNTGTLTAQCPPPIL